MAGKLKLIFGLGVVMALGCFTAFLLTRTGASSSTVQRLPDGNLFRLTAVSFTNGNLSYFVNPPTGWRAKLAGRLPDAWTDRLGWLQMGGGLTIGGSAEVTNLGWFTIFHAHTNQGLNGLRVVVGDDEGNTFNGGYEAGTMASYNSNEVIQINGWTLRAFPRRGKTLHLRYYQFAPTTSNWPPLAAFSIPNPAAGIYPIWSAEAMPLARSDGDLSVTLKSLKSGMCKGNPERPAASNEMAVTQAVFQLSGTNRATNWWRPVSVEISDATGNLWTPYANAYSTRHEGDADVFSFDGALWPGESAWKLRFEFSRIADFDDDELFSFTGINVPGATQVITLDNSTNLAGSKLQLIAISGESAEQPGNLKWSTVKQRVNVSIRIDPLPPDRRLTLVRMTDESGREVPVDDAPDWNSPEKIYSFQTPEGAKQLNFTFAFHRSRFVEFTAKPEFVRTN
jgi:hypothetical protein